MFSHAGDIPEDPDLTFLILSLSICEDLIKEAKEEGGFSIGAACYPKAILNVEQGAGYQILKKKGRLRSRLSYNPAIFRQ